MVNPGRYIFTGIMLFFLAGCAGRTFGGFEQVVEPVTETEVVRVLQYFDGFEAGPLYAVSVTVPADWVGQFETVNEGNTLVFNYITENDRRAPIFFIEALSRPQYWEQIGSYPGQYTNLVNTFDTYIIYHLPIDAYYSGLPRVEFEALAEDVPDIVASIQTEAVN